MRPLSPLPAATFAAAAVLAGAASAAEPAAPEPFVYRSDKAVAFTVTADGLSSIRLGGREVARGSWRAHNADGLFGLGSSSVQMRDLADRRMSVLAPDRVRVEHVHKDAAVSYLYTFAGEDATIEARVSNHHAADDLTVVGFRGLRFTWGKAPAGHLPCWHGSYIRAHPGEMFHPGAMVKIGGTFGSDGTFGVGTSPSNTRLARTLTHWDYADWTPVERKSDSRDRDPRRDLGYFVRVTLAPGSAATVRFHLRVSTSADWKHLLAPYKAYLRRALGPVRYNPDCRPVIQCCVNKAAKYITPDNPYGYHDGLNRLDTAAGVKQFCDALIPLLKRINGQGVLIWGQQGSEVRGCEYRPDFDVLPPETEANWKTLQARFAEARLHLGVCTRPDSIAVRATWTHDGLVELDPDRPGHLNMLWRRFEKMIAKGCTLFYMDCFGMRGDDWRTMRFLREKMGPDVQTFAEWHHDAILPFTGLYTEATYRPAAEGKPEGYDIAWLGARRWEIVRWLMDDRIAVVARPRIKDEEAGKAYDCFLRNHLTPMEQLWPLRQRLDLLAKLLPLYLDEKGRWLK